MATWINPPTFKKGMSYELYKQQVLAWAEVTEIEQSKKGIVVALSLPNEEKCYIQEKVFDQISLNDLKTDDGLAVLLNFLDEHFGKDDAVDSLEKYEAFENFEREVGQSIKDFICMFDFKYKKIEKKHMKLSSEVLAFRLLKKANITRKEMLLILTGLNFEDKPSLYQQAKKSLTKFHDYLEVSNEMKTKSVITDQFLVESNNGEKQNFPFKKCGNKLNRSGPDCIGNTRLLKPRGVIKRKINPTGKDGQILKCLSCGSFRHLLNDCPDSWENIERANTNKELNHDDKETVVCSKPKPFDGKIVGPDDGEALKAMMTSLCEKVAYLQVEIKQIKIDKDTGVQRQREDVECLKQTLKCMSEAQDDYRIGHGIRTVLDLSDDNHSIEKIKKQLRMENVSTANKHGQKTSTITENEKVLENSKKQNINKIKISPDKENLVSSNELLRSLVKLVKAIPAIDYNKRECGEWEITITSQKGVEEREENWNSDTYKRKAAGTEDLKWFEQNFVCAKETNFHQRMNKFE